MLNKSVDSEKMLMYSSGAFCYVIVLHESSTDKQWHSEN